MTKPKSYITVKEAACILGMSTTTVRKYYNLGLFTAYTYDHRRVVLLLRQVISLMEQRHKDYVKYRLSMDMYGWREIGREESYSINHGTLCVVHIGRNDWERWWDSNEDAEPPDDVGAFFCRVTHIVPMSGDEEEAADSPTGQLPHTVR